MLSSKNGTIVAVKPVINVVLRIFGEGIAFCYVNMSRLIILITVELELIALYF